MGLAPHVMAVERVQQRLHEVTAALGSAGVNYAVIGANAVAAWIARIDTAATRATNNIDIAAATDSHPNTPLSKNPFCLNPRTLPGIQQN